MKVTVFSNFFNHHQLDISREFIKQGCEYTFVATEAIPQSRLNLGYEDINKKYGFILTTYDSKENYNKALELAVESDIVIIGSAPDIFVKERIKQNKIIFRYSERAFKKGRYNISSLKTFIGLILRHTRYKNKNIYMLCASAYAAKDYLMAGAYKNKSYKWGYFPEKMQYDINELLKSKEHSKIQIIWVGRFLRWKHPELALELAKCLKNQRENFEITMIGNGELLENIKEKVKQEKLENYIKILGAIPSKEVRGYMESANIHIFTSDQNEGWGAVLNESMNSACAVVGNKKIGAVPYLVEDGINGYTYKNKKEFFYKVNKLMQDEELREKMGKEAYNTIATTWNAENAVSNLLKLYNKIILNKKKILINGPCSKDEKLL